MDTPGTGLNTFDSKNEQEFPSLVQNRSYVYKGRVIESKMHMSRDGGTQTFNDTIELDQVDDDPMESPSPIQTPAKYFDKEDVKKVPATVKG